VLPKEETRVNMWERGFVSN